VTIYKNIRRVGNPSTTTKIDACFRAFEEKKVKKMTGAPRKAHFGHYKQKFWLMAAQG
jgi:hypothetical protein